MGACGHCLCISYFSDINVLIVLVCLFNHSLTKITPRKKGKHKPVSDGVSGDLSYSCSRGTRWGLGDSMVKMMRLCCFDVVFACVCMCLPPGVNMYNLAGLCG